MKLTNKLGLPDALVAAVANDAYSRGDADLSVTQLIAPPRKVELERRHASEMEEDAADRIWLLLGKVAHGILERANSSALREERLFATIDGMKISGAFDHLTLDGEGILSDYKVTSVWSVKHASEKNEWEQQLNCYAYLAREAGYDVKRLRIVAICRDWRMSDAAKYADEGYPQHQVAIVEQPLWTRDEQYDFLRERVEAHQAARAGDLPLCSRDERWQKPDAWAVRRTGQTRAIKLFPSEIDAQRSIGTASGLEVDYRPGVAVRCESYCAARPFCSQAKGA